MNGKTTTENRQPRISVIVNTDGRAGPLRNTIESFRHLDYPNFEVVVVCGPTPDGTREVAQEYAEKGWVKYFECPERNLSRSRNIGIRNAAGEIVAFIDDDGIPEPEWLTELAPAFDDPKTGGAGGLVYDHTGYTYQYLYAACNRLGEAILDLKEPAEEFNFPYSDRFPYIQGTNSAFRRSHIVDIGGFDEEYEFYLDETDVCCRMVDAGLKIRQLDRAPVHHKFLPSNIRNEHRVTTVKYPVIKNKIYFSFVNNRGHYPLSVVLSTASRFAAQQRADLEYHVHGGRLHAIALEAFDEDQERAFHVGLTRGLSGERRTRPKSYFDAPPAFLTFPRLLPHEEQRRCLVFLSQSYPPEHSGGNARHTHDIARAIAALGHTVHVLTKGEGYNRVDLEEGVWVHRIMPKRQMPRLLPGDVAIPAHIWDYAATQLEELYRISKSRRIDAVEGVGWDTECIATVLDGRFPSATNIVTALDHWLDTHAHQKADPKWMAEFGRPMLSTEKLLFERSPAIISASRAIAVSIEERYDLKFRHGQIAYIPHGLVDTSGQVCRAPAALPALISNGVKPVLFVGRLELRKGIDVLLAAAAKILSADEKAEIWIAGDDTLEVQPGATVRSRYEASPDSAKAGTRIRFLGRASDEELRWLYANCAVFVAPSRFESFGLIFVEAMMYGKPCVGCLAGGVPEVVANGVTGLLVPPDDAPRLADAVVTLLRDEALRHRLGRNGRATFESSFESSVIAGKRLESLAALRREPVNSIEVSGDTRKVEAGYQQSATLLLPGAGIAFTASAPRLHITAWKHAWSGFMSVRVNGAEVADIDLFAPEGMFETIEIDLPHAARVSIARSGRKNDKSHGSEVIIAAIEVGGERT